MDELDLAFSVSYAEAVCYHEIIAIVRTMMMCGESHKFRNVKTVHFSTDKDGSRGIEFLGTLDICSMDIFPLHPSRSGIHIKVGNVHRLDTVLTEAGLGYLLAPLRKQVNKATGSWL